MTLTKHQTRIISIVGKRGCGKTSLARKFIREHKGIVFINDFIGEYDGIPFVTRRDVAELKSGAVYCYRGMASNAQEFCEVVYQAGKTGLHVLAVFDEIDVYGKFDKFIAFVYRYGRHRNVTCIAISRRPADMPVIVRALTHDWYIFTITEPADIKYLASVSNEIDALRLPTIPAFQYLKFSHK